MRTHRVLTLNVTASLHCRSALMCLAKHSVLSLLMTVRLTMTPLRLIFMVKMTVRPLSMNHLSSLSGPRSTCGLKLRVTVVLITTRAPRNLLTRASGRRTMILCSVRRNIRSTYGIGRRRSDVVVLRIATRCNGDLYISWLQIKALRVKRASKKITRTNFCVVPWRRQQRVRPPARRSDRLVLVVALLLHSYRHGPVRFSATWLLS